MLAGFKLVKMPENNKMFRKLSGDTPDLFSFQTNESEKNNKRKTHIVLKLLNIESKKKKRKKEKKAAII